MNYDAILFDFDGVLMDSEPVHYACWSEALRPLGFHLDWETYARTTIGISEAATMALFAKLSKPPLDLAEIQARYPLKKELFRGRMAGELPFAPGVKELVAWLDGQYRMAVVTSSARAEIEPLLVNGGIRERFQAVVCAEDVARHKPAPDAYLLAARLVGAQAPLVDRKSVV